ncbi:MAG: VOC family protein [Pikeienuella sp.]
MTQPTCRLDHLVVVADDLARGRAWAEERLGIPPGGEGRHAAMATHNVLWGLGDLYLEVIAPDPAAQPPARPRWFGLDDPEIRDRLADGPRLLTWAAATDDLAAVEAAAPLPLETLALERDDLTWEIALTPAAALPLGGAWPLLIRWKTGLHPARRLALSDPGLRLRELTVAGTGAAATRTSLGAVDPRLNWAPDAGPVRLSAVIDTPSGVVSV